MDPESEDEVAGVYGPREVVWDTALTTVRSRP